MKSSIMSNIPGESASVSLEFGSLSGTKQRKWRESVPENLLKYGLLSRLLRLISERSGMPGAGNFAIS